MNELPNNVDNNMERNRHVSMQQRATLREKYDLKHLENHKNTFIVGFVYFTYNFLIQIQKQKNKFNFEQTRIGRNVSLFATLFYCIAT